MHKLNPFPSIILFMFLLSSVLYRFIQKVGLNYSLPHILTGDLLFVLLRAGHCSRQFREIISRRSLCGAFSSSTATVHLPWKIWSTNQTNPMISHRKSVDQCWSPLLCVCEQLTSAYLTNLVWSLHTWTNWLTSMGRHVFIEQIPHLFILLHCKGCIFRNLSCCRNNSIGGEGNLAE